MQVMIVVFYWHNFNHRDSRFYMFFVFFPSLLIVKHNPPYDFMNIQPQLLPWGINTGVTGFLLFKI